MASYTLTRDLYISKDYQLIAKDERFGFEVWGAMQPRIVAVAFGGKRAKPDWHYRFQNEARLHAKIDETLRGFMQSEERKAEWKAKRNAPHDVQVGDVFRCSWGYDQTNIDYYEVTRVMGAMVEIRKIGCESVETEFMQGKSVPKRGAYIGEPIRKRVNMGGSEPSLAVHSFANAYRMKPIAKVGNAPIYDASHWTAYA